MAVLSIKKTDVIHKLDFFLIKSVFSKFSFCGWDFSFRIEGVTITRQEGEIMMGRNELKEWSHFLFLFMRQACSVMGYIIKPIFFFYCEMKGTMNLYYLWWVLIWYLDFILVFPMDRPLIFNLHSFVFKSVTSASNTFLSSV